MNLCLRYLPLTELRKIISKMYVRHQHHQKTRARTGGAGGGGGGVPSISFYVTFTRNQDHDYNRITLQAPQMFEDIASSLPPSPSTSSPSSTTKKSFLSHFLTRTKAGFRTGTRAIWPWKRTGSQASLALVRELIEPLSWWQRVIYRFRSFDYHRSPCRH